MRIIELAGTCLTVEFSGEDLAELSEDFDVTLPGRFLRMPGRLVDVFRACVGEVSVSKHASGPFVALDPQDGLNYPVAEMICAQWPEFDVDCDIRCYGMDGELWCCNECGSAGVVRRLTIHTAARSVTLRGALAGVGELDVFLTTYLPHAERAERNACMTSPRESLRNAT
ncbi:hypothetical protein [Bifidobacterium sp. UBA4282]|uniref:hypothetical protein n=1 Tax=Bifidobacterium sp. UBA4282 TaxID=1946096 RepID=UPI0025C55F71|nr:hypothetical protein [Bifidobacterium sp. UBA4282]